MHLLLLPFYALVLFGLVSATIVIYRTLTFNNCDQAAKDLKDEIVEAKEFLKKRGLIVGDN